MYKMTGFNSYSYFKDGGLEIKCCGSCKTKQLTNKFLAFFIALIVYGGVAILSQGWLLGIDLFLLWITSRSETFTIYKWFFNIIKSVFYYDKIAQHPLLKSKLEEGYKYGMPSNS